MCDDYKILDSFHMLAEAIDKAAKNGENETKKDNNQRLRDILKLYYQNNRNYGTKGGEQSYSNHKQEIIEEIFFEGRQQVLKLLEKNNNNNSEYNLSDALENIGEVLFLVTYLFRDTQDPKDTFEFYFWPGYQKIETNGKTKRLFITDDKKEVGVGFHYERSKSPEKYKSCFLSDYFNKTLSKKLKYKDFSLGGTHEWLFKGEGPRLFTGLPLNVLAVEMSDKESELGYKVNIPHRVLRIDLPKNIKNWGSHISSVLNASESKNEDNDLDTEGVFFKTKTSSQQSDNLKKQPPLIPRKIFWPYFDSQKKSFEKHELGFSLETSERLYNIWLASCFAPDSINPVFIKDNFAVVSSCNNKIKDVYEKITNKLQKFCAPTSNKYVFSKWYSFRIDKTARIKNIDSNTANLGSLMVLTNAKISNRFFQQIISWIKNLFQDFRQMEMLRFISSEVKAQHKSAISHSMIDYINYPFETMLEIMHNCAHCQQTDMDRLRLSLVSLNHIKTSFELWRGVKIQPDEETILDFRQSIWSAHHAVHGKIIKRIDNNRRKLNILLDDKEDKDLKEILRDEATSCESLDEYDVWTSEILDQIKSLANKYGKFRGITTKWMSHISLVFNSLFKQACYHTLIYNRFKRMNGLYSESVSIYKILTIDTDNRFIVHIKNPILKTGKINKAIIEKTSDYQELEEYRKKFRSIAKDKWDDFIWDVKNDMSVIKLDFSPFVELKNKVITNE